MITLGTAMADQKNNTKTKSEGFAEGKVAKCFLLHIFCHLERGMTPFADYEVIFFLRAGVTVLFIRLYCVELCLPILYVIHESLHSQSVKIRNIYLSMLKFTTRLSF